MVLLSIYKLSCETVGREKTTRSGSQEEALGRSGKATTGDDGGNGKAKTRN